MIYCVEDEEEIRNLITYTLQSSGFEVKGFNDVDKFWNDIKNELPELILLDIMLPKEDGISILKKLKANSRTRNIPVIMETAKSSEYDKILGLDIGADDYLAKPFGMMEMVSRVKAVLRRTNAHKNNEDYLINGGISVNKQKREVISDEQKINLTLKEYELLVLLLENPDIVLTREKLLNEVWGMEFIGESRTVDVHVGTLRTKLGNNGKYIETIRGVGYKMVKENEEKNI